MTCSLLRIDCFRTRVKFFSKFSHENRWPDPMKSMFSFSWKLLSWSLYNLIILKAFRSKVVPLKNIKISIIVGHKKIYKKCQLGEVPVGGLLPVGGQKFNLWRCTGSWGTQILNGTKKSSKKCQLGEVPVGGSASWGKCQLGDKGQLGDKI